MLTSLLPAPDFSALALSTNLLASVVAQAEEKKVQLSHFGSQIELYGFTIEG